MRRLVIQMRTGNPHILDFETDDEAAQALTEVNQALAARGGWGHPSTIADRLVVLPGDIRSAELTDPPNPA